MNAPMMNAPSKIKIRVRAERMPTHMLEAPRKAPGCYGDPQRRALNRFCEDCAFNAECAEFVDRACMDGKLGIKDRSAHRTRGVWPADAPLVIGLRTPRNPRPVHAPLGGIWKSHALVDIVKLVGHHGATLRIADAAASWGLITTDAAVELALRAEQFERWIFVRNQRGGPMVSSRDTAVIWLAGAITERALLGQGRAHAMGLKFHRELLDLTNGPVLSYEAFRSRRRRLPALYEQFADEVFGAPTLPLDG